MDSILTSIKELLGITEKQTEFDNEIIMHINSVFMILTQLGVGPSKGFAIENDSACWDEFLDDPVELQAVKSYMFLRVKLLFDSNSIPSSVIESMNRQIAEFEWRLNVAAESKQAT